MIYEAINMHYPPPFRLLFLSHLFQTHTHKQKTHKHVSTNKVLELLS